MKVILQQDVKGQGKKGDVIEASEGYARNFLLPKQLAIPATESNLNTVKQQKASAAHHQQRMIDEAKLMANQVGKLSVEIPVRIGEGGKLFGSVTSKDVADALQAQHGIELDKRKIELKDGVKNLGTYTAVIKLHTEVSTTIEVKVTAEKE